MSTTQSSPGDRHPPTDAFHTALGKYLARVEHEGTRALEEFQRDHPEFAARLGKQLDWLAAHLGRRKDGIPERIGPYRVVQRLGAGGMGEVFLAEQTEPFQRVVAIKVIRADRAGDGRLARFADEIQALASLNHDGIAKVFEAGHDAGRPYFTMEYVPGRPVTDYCADERLGLGARLALFLRVCGAVEHAHRHGILHRDLKPSNILVHGSEPDVAVKIIDFGLAKALTPAAGEPPRTMTGQILGTPDYMSPEQVADDTPHHVDTRADVYSLGVVLYELLTGVLPLGLWQQKLEDFRELRRAIREREPSSPSVRVEAPSSDPTASPAHGEGVTPHRLSRMLAGDLDAIVMKALAKDAALRYGSVAELAADIVRHLRHEPVLARTRTRAYVFAKFVRRHRAAVVFATTLLLVAIVALAIIAALARANLRNLERGDLFGLANAVQFLRSQDAIPEPARPEHVAEHQALLDEFRRVVAQRDRLRAFVADPARHGADVGWASGEQMHGPWVEFVASTAHLLDRMLVPNGEIDRLAQRVDWAKHVVARTVDAHAEAWRRAADEVRRDPRFAGFTLRPQTGLVPLRADPSTGLQEFALLLPQGTLPRAEPGGYAIEPTTCPVFVLIPGGEARLGAQNEDPGAPHYDLDRVVAEGAVREVSLAPFFLAKYELTNGQWNLVDSGRDSEALRAEFAAPEQPLVEVDGDALLHELHAWGMRLPTGDEWEYAARAGAEMRFGTGDDPLSLEGHANVYDHEATSRQIQGESAPAAWSDGFPHTAPVGRFVANAFGLFDIHGNALEVAVRSRSADREVLEMRGGSWHQGPRAARFTATVRYAGEARASIGVRPAISLVP